MRRSSLLVLLLSLAACVRLIGVWDALPETMASHFGASGRPDGWMSRTAFLVAFGGVWLLCVVPLAWTGWLRRMPAHLINLPHREYWFPERRDEAVQLLESYLGWFAVALTALLVVALELTLQANLTRSPLDEGVFLAALGAFLVFTVVWLVVLYRAFRPPEKA